MTDWFAEVGRPKPFLRAGIWILAAGISLLVNWAAARQLDLVLQEGRERAAATGERESGLDVRVIPFEERFVEPNPEVPANPPDETNQFGARDQQAAEEEPDPSSDSGFPSRDSNEESQTFLQRGETAERLPPGLYSEAAEAAPPEESDAGTLGELAPQTERETPEWIENRSEGPGGRIPEAAMGEKKDPDEPERRPGVLVLDDRPQTTGADEPRAAVNNPAARPLPRKKVGAEVLLAPLNRSEERASRRGELAVDSRLTDFGDYTQRALEAIQAEWHRLVRETSVGTGATFSSVQVEFFIDRRGSIDEARIVESTAGDLGAIICLDAIHARAPYGAWTEEMVRVLGERTRMEITFHYR